MEDDIKQLFIVEENVSGLNAEALARRTLPFGKIARDGSVIIDDRSLSKGDQQKLALVIRYVANLLDESIPRTIRPVDLTTTLGQRIEAIGAGLSGLLSDGFAKREGTGQYSVLPYRIDEFLQHLEQKRSAPTGEKKHKLTRRKKSQPLSGIGTHIERLIGDGFFDAPRMMSEVVARLKQENVFRDERVVDKTVRDTFVSARRTLQRIPNDGPGLARWKYVVRK